ncbi:MAG: hypothetical protein RI101_03945 [Nitrospira sp.]|jgi:hypothetical protein|nr:hypothetical protein [Nitrospira sp.]
MRIHRVWSSCAIVLAAMSVVSCAEGQFGQVMQNLGKGMAQSMCGEGKGPVSGAPEYCLYVTDLQVLRDGGATAGISLVSRTRGRYAMWLTKASLTDNSGGSWRISSSSGLPLGTQYYPLLLDPTSEGQVSIKFASNDAGVRPGSVFTLEGEIYLRQADAQGNPVGTAGSRGFRVIGIPLAQSKLSSQQGNILLPSQVSGTPTPDEGKSDSRVSLGNPTIKSKDVIGITIGMGVTEVKDLLSAKFPSSSNFPINFDSYGKQWIGQYASLPVAMMKKNNTFDKKADEVVIVDFSNPPVKQEVLAVAKYQSYPNDKTPGLLATETGLIEKYGQWDKREEKGGANYYYWGINSQTNSSCIPLQLIDPSYRLKDLVRGESAQAVICQAYGTWGQCIKPVRNYISLDLSLKGCGVQAAAYVRFTSKQSKEVSPVTEIATFVVDLNRLYDSEIAFTDLAEKYEKDKNQKAISSGGAPKL